MEEQIRNQRRNSSFFADLAWVESFSSGSSMHCWSSCPGLWDCAGLLDHSHNRSVRQLLCQKSPAPVNQTLLFLLKQRHHSNFKWKASSLSLLWLAVSHGVSESGVVSLRGIAMDWRCSFLDWIFFSKSALRKLEGKGGPEGSNFYLSESQVW